MSAQLQQAIINAHNAGDVAAAQRLGQMLKRERQSSQVAPQAASPSGVPPHRLNQATQPKAKDGAFEGYGNAFMRGIDQPLENMGVTAEALGAKGLGESLKGAVDERPGQSASGQFMNADKDGTFAYRYLPKAAVEQAGQFAGSLLARAGGAAVGGAVGNVPGAIAGGLAGPMLFEFTQQLGPIALERAKNNGRETPNKEDWTYATGTSAGVGALNAIAPGATGKIKRMLIEGVTEGTQSVGEQVGSTVNTDKGLEVDPRQAVAEGLIGGTSAGMVDTSVGTVKAAANLVRGNSKSIKSEGDVEAAASFAQRITTIANANEYDLKDIDKMSTKGARETIDKAHVQYTEELKQKFADLKSRVKVTDQDSLTEVADKIMTAAAYREGRNKTKNTVGTQEMAALERLTGDTREGQEAMSILRQLNQLTEVHNNGYQGGVSQVTDQFAPFGASVGYDKGAVATERLLRPLASGSAAITTGGSSLLAQAAAQGTGRLIDKVTGKRSKVANYVKENSGNQGIPGSNSASLRETNIANMAAEEAAVEEARLRQEQMAQEEREASLESAQNNDPANPESPQGIFELGTALDRNGIAQIIRIMKRNPSTQAATLRMIEAYETSVATGGQVDFALIRKINGFVDRNSVYKGLMGNRVRNQGVVQQAAQQQLSQKEQNYQRGIDNNRAEAARISEAVSQDNTIEVQHKAHLLATLEEMQLDLGLNPVGRLEAMQKRLEEKGVPGPTVEKYLGQYLQRVGQQQGAKEERDAAQDDAMEIDESRAPSFTDGPALAFDTSPNVIALMDGSETPPKLKGKTEVAKFLQERALAKLGGKPRDLESEADREAIANDMVAEAIHEMESTDSAMEWYDSVIAKMTEMMSIKHPELNTDPNAKTALLVSIAITSQNLAVPDNLKYGEEVYSFYKKNGKFLEKKYGSKGPAIKKNLEKANLLLEKLGSMDALTDFLQTKFTVKELEPILQNHLDKKSKQISGENMETEVYGSQVFGPKIGNGFYTNLRGDFSPVTIDMWFMRTVGRLQGRVLAFDEKKFQGQLERLKKAIGRKRISREALISEATEIKKKHEKDYKVNRAKYDSKERKKSEATNAAEQIVISLKGTRDVPSSGGERKNLRDIVNRAVEKFKVQTGIDIPPASFQALIWYPEQDLYKKLGVTLKSTRQDYASSTKRLLLEEGYNEQDIDNAAARIRSSGEPGPGQVRQGPGISDQSPNGNPDGRSGSPLQREESAAEVNLSAAPGSGALTQPESPQIPFDFTSPTVGQIKDKLEDAKGAVQMVIGKPGTQFENGLSSMEDFKQLADMLNVSVGIFDSQKEFMEKYKVGSGTRGLYGSNKGGVSGQIAILANGIESDLLYTTAHESAHPLESRPASNEEAELLFGRKVSGRHPKSENVKRNVYTNSLRAKLRGKYGSDPVIQAEIDKLQDGTVISIANRPDLPGTPIRLNIGQVYDKFREENPQGSKGQAFLDVQNQFPAYQGYIKGDGEFAVDPVMFYLINPKAMKKDMPNTFKFMQKHFNESNIPIKIYASPLATIMAILMAGMIGGEEEEENPGVLTPGPGMLTA